MGNSNSSETIPINGDKSPTKRTYRTPDVREKERFTSSEASIVQGTFETSVDKYDFLILFRITEGPQRSKLLGDDTKVKWKDVKEIWRKCVAGSDRAKENSINSLKTLWTERTRKEPQDTDDIDQGAWLSMARLLIIDQLSGKAGMQLKISSNNQYLFCRLRVPLKLLEVQADREAYRLQFKGEIDPGSMEFWNREVNRLVSVPDEDGNIKKVVKRLAVELEEERNVYSRYDANHRLEKLYRVGKIGASELGISSNDENQSMLSRRVHALERIADKVPVWNRYPVYAPFSSDAHLRYLYNVYHGVRGKSLFRSKDRLYLSKAMLDKNFDFGQLQENSVVKFLCVLHDANRGERVTSEVLQKRWVLFWLCTEYEVGSPLVTDEAYENEEFIWWYWRPLAQPLVDIREYFGEKVALFYAWLGHYTYYLLFPVIASALVAIIRRFPFGNPENGSVDWVSIALAIFVITWVVFYMRSWEAQEKAIAIKWGTSGFESVQKDRPQFKGEDLPDGGVLRSVVNNQIILYYPPEKRVGKQVLSVFVVLSCIVVVVLVNVLMFFMIKKYNIETVLSTHANPVTNPWALTSYQYIMFAVITPLFSYVFSFISVWTNNYENYQTDVDYEDALIAKSLFFQIFNNFTALFFVAFARKPLFNDCILNDCTRDLRELLICIFLVRYILMITDVARPAYQAAVDSALDKAALALTVVGDAATVEDPDMKYYLDEIYRIEYLGPFKDYADTCIQFGYVTLFMSVVPLIAFLAFVENLIKIRLNAWKLCSLARRPFPELVEDVGMWVKLMETMSILGFIVNTALIVFASDSFDSYSFTEKALIFLLAEQTLLCYKILLNRMFPEVPEWIDDIAKRNDFVEQKYKLGIDDDEEDSSSNIKGNLDDPVDIDRLTLHDIRREKITTKMYKRMEGLEDKRRLLMRDLRSVKDQLQEAYKTETFNEVTGIGENKHGLPLGRLSVKLLEMQQYLAKDRPYEICIRVNIEWKGKRQATPPGPPIGPYSLSKIVEARSKSAEKGMSSIFDKAMGSSDKGICVFDQSLGPFAPIRTLDAMVVFEVLDAEPNKNFPVVGKAQIGLRELQDQNQAEKTLTVSFPKLSEDGDASTIENDYAKLFVVLQFQFSKVQPLRTRIYHLQDEIRGIEKELAELNAGNKLPDDED